jgi:hypothetical protein
MSLKYKVNPIQDSTPVLGLPRSPKVRGWGLE